MICLNHRQPKSRQSRDVIANANAAGVKQGSTMHWGPNGETLTTVPDNSAGAFDNGWLGQHQRPLEHETGFASTIEMGARQYDPVLGRFLETDPIEGGSANDYDYVAADPVNSLDLSGECRVWKKDGIWHQSDYDDPLTAGLIKLFSLRPPTSAKDGVAAAGGSAAQRAAKRAEPGRRVWSRLLNGRKGFKIRGAGASGMAITALATFADLNTTSCGPSYVGACCAGKATYMCSTQQARKHGGSCGP